LVLTTIAIFAQTHSTTAEILAVEKSRTSALEHSDLTALDKLLADDLTYVHASGKVDSKTSFLDALRSGDLRYLSWEPGDLQVRLLTNTAVLTGTYHVRAIDQRMQADPLDVQIIVLGVYAKRAGRWQQVAWQSTREPAAKTK
jgi:hypothetical protein